jgi:TetR/AcrR family transcriptional regulator, tetracycline repressor protein
LTSNPDDRRGRGRWRYGELGRDDVVDAALRLARRDGLAALSMRRLAAELGTSTTHAYYFVPNKQALLDLAADAVLGQVAEPPADRPWDERLAALFADGRRVLLGYPGVADHLLVRRLGHPNEARLHRLVDGILTGAGFDRRASDATQRVLAYMLFGAVTSEAATTAAADDERTLHFSDDDEVFRFGLELVLAGLRSRAGAGTRSTGPDQGVA